MVETEDGPLLLVDVAALIAGPAAKRRSGLSLSLPLPLRRRAERTERNASMKTCLIVDD